MIFDTMCRLECVQIELEAALAKHDVKVSSLIPGSLEIVPKTLKKVGSLFTK